jgi:hypothetical protein
MTIQKVKSGRVNNISADEYIGEIGQLFYNELLGDLRVSNGATPGGISILSNIGSGGTGNANIYSGSSAPSPSSNMMWYNPSTDILKIYISGSWQPVSILVGTGLVSSNGIVSTDMTYISGNLSVGSGITHSGSQVVLDMSYIGSNLSIGNGLQSIGGQLSVNMSYILSNITSGNANISIGTSSPSSPNNNQLWYNPSSDIMQVYVSGLWKPVGVSVGSGLISSNGQVSLDMSYVLSNIGSTSIYVNTSAPGSPTSNMLWYNPSSDILQVYVSSSWKLVGISIGSGLINSNGVTSIDMSYVSSYLSVGSGVSIVSGTVQLDMAYLMGHLQLGSGLVVSNGSLTLDMTYISGQITSGSASIYSGSSAPVSPVQNMLWYNTSSNILSIYISSNWVSISISAGNGIISSSGVVSIDMSYVYNNLSIGNGLIRSSGVIGVDSNYINLNIDGGSASSTYGSIPVMDFGGV